MISFSDDDPLALILQSRRPGQSDPCRKGKVRKGKEQAVGRPSAGQLARFLSSHGLMEQSATSNQPVA
jgi:hypothetical protein